jgi:hypothetical protein
MRPHLSSLAPNPIEIVSPDVNSAEFKAEAHRQSVAVSQSPDAEADQDFIDSISDWSSE